MWDMSRESQGLGLKLELLKFRMLSSTTNISNMTNLYNAPKGATNKNEC